MNKVLKAAQLDFKLIQYYVKSICFTVCIPFAFVLVYRSLVMGISFAMFMMAMSSIYTFTVAEKNDMQRLYGILPVSRAELVCGKYLHVLLMGGISLAVSGIVHPLILKLVGVSAAPMEIFTAVLAGLVLFVTYIAFQIPGYYKFGAIRGRVFMYIPLAGVLLTMLVLEKAEIRNLAFLKWLGQNQSLIPAFVFLYLVLVLAASIRISIGIVINKEG